MVVMRVVLQTRGDGGKSREKRTKRQRGVRVEKRVLSYDLRMGVSQKM